MQDNNLSSSIISPGQVLDIPSETYTVQTGDSLYLISQRFGVSVYELRLLNNKWDDMIYPGQTIYIPSSASNSGQSVQSSSSAVISYTASEVDLLARLIGAEAEGEPYTAKVAVAAVVVNRVKDSRFPNSITDVIYQNDGGYCQFSPVANGMINNPASADDIKAAYEALNGSDPTNGALYYFDDSTTNTWLWSKTVALRVDKMVFSYY